MKNIVLSVVVISALIAAAVGGTLADFSDIETSKDNTFETGSLDLKVSQTIGGVTTYYDDPNVPTLLKVANAMPECLSKDVAFDLKNDGKYDQGTGYVYIHFKNLVCEDTGKTEPEIAVEEGTTPIGELDDGTFVYAVPPLGTDWGTTAACELADHVDVRIAVSTQGPNGGFVDVDLSAYDANGDDNIKLGELLCWQILLSELGSQKTIWVEIYFRLQDIPEGDLGYDLFPAGNKFEHWPTNALQDDQMKFDISFELFQFVKQVPMP
jgi:predicted ribosomally synthesized peptide with SipW-like signal peptide